MLCDKNKRYYERATGIRTRRGQYRPVEMLDELGDVDVENKVFGIAVVAARVETRGDVVCTGAVEAVVRVKELCDELPAEAK